MALRSFLLAARIATQKRPQSLALAWAECCHHERQRIGSAGAGGVVRVRIWGKFRGKSLRNLPVSSLFLAISRKPLSYGAAVRRL